MPTYRLLVEYEGTKFAGWQAQASGRTVQGVLLETLRALTGERGLDLQGAGRTDAGVHALGQVASLRCRQSLDCGTLRRDLERELPTDLAVLDLRAAPKGFHARHDAEVRAYRYQIATRRSAFGKRVSWWITGGLDVTAMTDAAAAFVGRHDFRAFARRSREAESTIVEVESCDVASFTGCVMIRAVASHFLWNQVRRMVGTLVTVGRGEGGPAEVRRWLSGRAPAPPLAAPAAGLFLEAVRYPGETWQLQPLAPIGLPFRDEPVLPLARAEG
jgi:tRNA pseudouridine38-40 synthase